MRKQDEGDAVQQANPLHEEMPRNQPEQVARPKRIRSEEYKRKQRDRYRERYNNDPAFRERQTLLRHVRMAAPEKKERERARGRRRYQSKGREYHRERKRRWVSENRDRVNEYRRSYYRARAGERIRKQVFDGRRRRDPLHGLQSTIWKLVRGDISFDEYLQQFDRSLTRVDEICGDKKQSGE